MGLKLAQLDAKRNVRLALPAISTAFVVFQLFIGGLDCFRRIFATFIPEERACLFDVVDVNHRLGERDAKFRSNQISAVGGLPFQLIARIER